jgi:hypothetical protein
MAPNPFNTDNTGLKGELRNESVIVPPDVEDDYVVAQKTRGCVSLPNIVGSTPVRILHIGDPIDDPVTAIRMTGTVCM